MQVFKEMGKPKYPGGKPLRAEKRTNKFNPHMTPSLEIEPGPRWWEASALTTPPPLLSKIHDSNIVIATKRPASGTLVASLAKRSSVAAADESTHTMLALSTPHSPFHVLIQLLRQESWTIMQKEYSSWKMVLWR